MTAAKRSRRTPRQTGVDRNDGAGAVATTSPDHSHLPASKRLKSAHLSTASHTDLGFLVEERGGNRKSLDARLTNGTPGRRANRVDESHAVVSADANGSDAMIVDGDAQNGPHDGSDGEQEGHRIDRHVQVNGFGAGDRTSRRHGTVNVLHVNGDAQNKPLANGDEHGGDDADVEPSFGDRLKKRHPRPIHIQRDLPEPRPEPPRPPPTSGRDALIRPVAGHSLTTVLQQALKTNDKDMLEQCFELRDVQAIHNTIDRLRPPTVIQLMARIAERMYHKPSRTGSLMEWLQRSLVAHGGYLTTQPETLRKMRSLNQVVRQRAQGLQPLLQLQGKLDMLTAQLEVRRSGSDRRLHADLANEENLVMYTEGHDDDAWDDASGEQRGGSKQLQASHRTATINGALLNGDIDYEESLADDAAEDEDLESMDSAEDEGEDTVRVMYDVEAEESDDEEEARDGEGGPDSDRASQSEEHVEDDEHDGISDREGQPPRLHKMNRKR